MEYTQKHAARILKVVQDQDPDNFPEHLKKFVQKHLPPQISPID